MRSVFTCTSLVIVVSSVFSQQPFVRYSENLRKAVPWHYNHDQENADRRMDKVARGHQKEPYQPPLRPHQTVPWLRWVHEGRWAAHANKNTEQYRVRARLLEQKLKPNQLVFKPRINPQLKPKIKQKENARVKRESEKTEKENVHKEIKIEENVRHKRDIMMPQLLPEMIMQPHLEAKMPQPSDQFKEAPKETEKREKRDILYVINRPPKLFARSPRTTPNPFIRDTHIEDYDIIRPDVGEREGMIPTIESRSSDLGSYPLVNGEATEFSNTISRFYLRTNDEHWPQIQQLADNLKFLSILMETKKKLTVAIESIKDNGQHIKALEVRSNNGDWNKKSSTNQNIVIHKRVKRRVNKTLKRKRAKKKKQRLRRFERKRLRMLTHARRVRRQQKSKQARLQRHYARMNMSTTEIPEHLRNQTLIGKVEVEGDTKSEDEDDGNDYNDDENEETEEEDEEYESSEYEDESEDSESENKSEKNSKESQEKSDESDESDDNETEESEISGTPDYGNDSYEDYDDESDDEYEDDSTEEESERKRKKTEKGRKTEKGKKSEKGKKMKSAIKNERKHTLKMLNGYKNNQGIVNQRNNGNNKMIINKENLSSFDRNTNVNTKSIDKKHIYNHMKRNNIMSLQKQSPLLQHDGRTQTEKKYLMGNMVNEHLKISEHGLHKQSAIRPH